MNRYTINKHYFDNIDNENKAYWLGFLWADGSVVHRIRGKSNEFTIKLCVCESDENHLYKFKNDISSTHPVKRYYNGDDSYSNGYHNRICFSNTHMGTTLINKYGLCSFRKDFLKYSHVIPLDLRRHFIRGIFDGDGCINEVNNDELYKLNINFSTNTEVIDYIENVLIDEAIINDKFRKRYIRHVDRDYDCKTFIIGGTNQSVRLLNYMYSNSNVYLDRKFNHYVNILKGVKV